MIATDYLQFPYCLFVNLATELIVLTILLLFILRSLFFQRLNVI